MNIDKFEIWVHDYILKNDNFRHFVYGIYQRVLYLLSPKIKIEGDVFAVTPNDEYEYLFGYYDKSPWDVEEKKLLSLRVKNARKHADCVDEAEIVIIDLEKNNEINVVATTHAWNVQQGCMLQWLSGNKILYNDFRENKLCTVILDLVTNKERLIDRPVYTVSEDYQTALSLDFTRLHRLRPGYGYANVEESTRDEICPDETCIWKINLETGEIISLLKYTDFANFETKESMIGAEHKVNHIMISPNGNRFMVLHRWFKDKIKYTRLVTCNIDGTEMYNLSDDDFVSHCCWKNDTEILSYLNKKVDGKGYYLLKDKTQDFEKKWEKLVFDGHPTYSYKGDMVVTDTYPDRRRIQSIYIIKDDEIKRVARMFSPFKYEGDVRCDLHPRWRKNGKQICFDGTFDGKRRVYILNL